MTTTLKGQQRQRGLRRQRRRLRDPSQEADEEAEEEEDGRGEEGRCEENRVDFARSLRSRRQRRRFANTLTRVAGEEGDLSTLSRHFHTKSLPYSVGKKLLLHVFTVFHYFSLFFTGTPVLFYPGLPTPLPGWLARTATSQL